MSCGFGAVFHPWSEQGPRVRKPPRVYQGWSAVQEFSQVYLLLFNPKFYLHRPFFPAFPDRPFLWAEQIFYIIASLKPAYFLSAIGIDCSILRGFISSPKGLSCAVIHHQINLPNHRQQRSGRTKWYLEKIPGINGSGWFWWKRSFR